MYQRILVPTDGSPTAGKALATAIRMAKAFGARLGETVADAARNWKADLIIVGTHGRRGLGRVLLGIGAEQIIRQAPVHVLVVRAPAE